MGVAIEPVGVREARAGKAVRIYSAPEFIRPDGKTWRPINDVVTVSYQTLQGAFRVSVAEKWAELRRVTAISPETIHAIRTGRSFGLLLDAEKAPATLEWDLAFSAGAKQIADGVELAEFDGVKLGLFIADWKERFGAGFHQDGSRITLDISYARTRKLRDGKTILDLDPTTIYTSGWKSYLVYDEESGAWETCRNAAMAMVVGTTPDVTAEGDGDAFAAIRRLALQFDTSAYPSVSAATFNVYWDYDSSVGSEIDSAHVSRVTMGGYGLTDEEVYASIKSAYETNPSGYFPIEGIPENKWVDKDILSIYQGASNFTLGLVHYNDKEDAVEDMNITVAFDLAQTPYLEITPAAVVPQAMGHYRRLRCNS